MRFDYLKKVMILMVAAGSVTMVGISNLSAQGGPTPVQEVGPMLGYSQTTASATSSIVGSLTNPNTSGVMQILTAMLTLMNNSGWSTTDTKINQAPFSSMFTLGAQVASNSMSSLNTNSSLLSGYNTTQMNAIGANSSNLPNAADLTFSTTLGQPTLWNNNNNASQIAAHAANWVANASGLNIRHVIPNPSWQNTGGAYNYSVYNNYFNSVMTAASFNAYALSSLQTNNVLASYEQTAMSQMSDSSNWLSTIATENIGWVLRQILVFQSIAVVYLIHIAQINENILVANVVTNNLIMSANQQWESNMVMKAQGTKPTGS